MNFSAVGSWILRGKANKQMHVYIFVCKRVILVWKRERERERVEERSGLRAGRERAGLFIFEDIISSRSRSCTLHFVYSKETTQKKNTVKNKIIDK